MCQRCISWVNYEDNHCVRDMRMNESGLLNHSWSCIISCAACAYFKFNYSICSVNWKPSANYCWSIGKYIWCRDYAEISSIHVRLLPQLHTCIHRYAQILQWTINILYFYNRWKQKMKSLLLLLFSSHETFFLWRKLSKHVYHLDSGNHSNVFMYRYFWIFATAIAWRSKLIYY
jgi:hypothetical protein